MRIAPRAIYLVVTCMVVGSAFVAAAHAGTAELRVVEEADRSWAQFTYLATPGQRNRPQIGFDGSADGSYPSIWDPSKRPPPTPRAILVYDQTNDYGPAPMVPGPGCAHHSNAPEWLRCPLPPGTLLRAPRISLGDRSDHLSWSLPGSHIFAGPGHDAVGVTATAGLRVYGGPGFDRLDLYGGRGIAATRRRAALFGGEGRDYSGGSEGPDLIVPGRGTDSVDARGGADVILTADGRLEEFVDCGPGKDELIADGIDSPENCEQIRRRGAARAIPVGVTVWVEEDLVELFVRCPSDVSGGCRGDVSLALGPRISPGGPRTLETRRLAGRPDALISLYYKVRLLRPQPLRPRFRVTVRTRDRRGVVHPVTRTLWAFVETPDSE